MQKFEPKNRKNAQKQNMRCGQKMPVSAIYLLHLAFVLFRCCPEWTMGFLAYTRLILDKTISFGLVLDTKPKTNLLFYADFSGCKTNLYFLNFRLNVKCFYNSIITV